MKRRTFLALSLLSPLAFSHEVIPEPQQKLYDLWSDGKNLFAVGYALGAVGLIIQTKDGGATWTQPKSNTTQTLHSIWGTKAGLYAAGTNGVIVASTDKGRTWSRQKTPTRATILSLWGTKAGLYAVGTEGLILKRSGTDWVLKESKTAQTLGQLTGTKTALWAAGAGGTLLRSTDAGETWSSLSLPIKTTISGLWTQGASLLLSAGNVILRSKDEGKTWEQTKAEGVLSIWSINEQEFWFAGTGGVVSRSTDAGVTLSKTETKLGSTITALWGTNERLYAASQNGGLAVYQGETWSILIKERLNTSR